MPPVMQCMTSSGLDGAWIALSTSIRTADRRVDGRWSWRGPESAADDWWWRPTVGGFGGVGDPRRACRWRSAPSMSLATRAGYVVGNPRRAFRWRSAPSMSFGNPRRVWRGQPAPSGWCRAVLIAALGQTKKNAPGKQCSAGAFGGWCSIGDPRSTPVRRMPYSMAPILATRSAVRQL